MNAPSLPASPFDPALADHLKRQQAAYILQELARYRKAARLTGPRPGLRLKPKTRLAWHNLKLHPLTAQEIRDRLAQLTDMQRDLRGPDWKPGSSQTRIAALMLNTPKGAAA